MRSARVPTILRAAAIVLMVGSAIGFMASLAVGAFVLDRYDAYGEVPIPGTGKVHLPVGRVTVSFHTTIVGGARGGGGLPVPHLVLDIDPPAGVAHPRVTENVGSSTSINGDIHRRVWEVRIVTEDDYIVTTGGDVNGFIAPRMAFGYHSDSDNAWTSIAAGLFVVGLAGTITASVWLSRARRVQSESSVRCVSTPAPGEAAKIEQLRTLAGLRDSGALTDKEFQAEKRRVLEGD